MINIAASGHLVFGDNADFQHQCSFAAVLSPMEYRANVMVGSLPRFDHDQTYFTEMPQLLLYEVGTHLLDVSRYFFGNPQAVYTRSHHISPDVIGEDVEVMTLAYENMTLVIHDSWASVPIPDLDRPDFERRRHHRLVEIEGTKGSLVPRLV